MKLKTGGEDGDEAGTSRYGAATVLVDVGIFGRETARSRCSAAGVASVTPYRTVWYYSPVCSFSLRV